MSQPPLKPIRKSIFIWGLTWTFVGIGLLAWGISYFSYYPAGAAAVAQWAIFLGVIIYAVASDYSYSPEHLKIGFSEIPFKQAQWAFLKSGRRVEVRYGKRRHCLRAWMFRPSSWNEFQACVGEARGRRRGFPSECERRR